MTEELEQLLKNLKLRRMLSVYDEQLRAAEKAQTSYSEFVAGLLRAQWHERQDSALAWMMLRPRPPILFPAWGISKQRYLVTSREQRSPTQ